MIESPEELAVREWIKQGNQLRRTLVLEILKHSMAERGELKEVIGSISKAGYPGPNLEEWTAKKKGLVMHLALLGAMSVQIGIEEGDLASMKHFPDDPKAGAQAMLTSVLERVGLEAIPF